MGVPNNPVVPASDSSILRERRSLGVAKAPCKSCPYRQDVPSGVWDVEEYAKLPGYDGEIIDQLRAGATGLFLCHQQDGNLCAGWLACHGHNLLALRLHGGTIADSALDYMTRIPVFRSGSAAAAHGLAEVERPGKRARSLIERLVRNRLSAPSPTPHTRPDDKSGEGSNGSD